VKILALELSSARGSIAWRDGSAEPVAAQFANDRKHSGLFFKQLAQSIQQLPKPDRIAVGLGPGSYAGTRIAIASALGLRAATGAALVGISSIVALAVEPSEYIVVGDARRQTFYFARVEKRQLIQPPLLCRADELRERILAADLPVFTTEPLTAFPAIDVAYPSAEVLVQLAAVQALLDAGAPLEPMYLREPHITQAKPAVGRAAP